MGQKLVARTLKAPATAQFAPADEWHFEQIDDHTQRVTAWVDSQNSFGALLRSHFTAIITHNGDQWRLQYLKLGDSDAIGEYRHTPDELRAIDERAQRQKTEASEAAKRRREAEEIARIARQKEEDAAWERQRRQLDELRAKSPDPAVEEERRREQIEQFAKEQQEASNRLIREQMAAEEAKYHRWKPTNDVDPFDAKIVSFANGKLRLADRKGKPITVMLTDLTADDKTFFDKWLEDKRSTYKPPALPAREPDPPKTKSDERKRKERRE